METSVHHYEVDMIPEASSTETLADDADCVKKLNYKGEDTLKELFVDQIGQ